MQLVTVNSLTSQLSTLALPSAALVVDLRGVDDELLGMLKIDIENLASEMDMHNANHWRYLTKFLAFKSLRPLTTSEVNHLRSLTKSPDGQASHAGANGQSGTASTTSSTQGKLRTVLGFTDQRDQHRFFPSHIFRDNEQSAPIHGPNDEFLRNVKECILEIDYVRNERIKATGDLGKDGRAGHNTRNTLVYVIFLADVERPESLSSAAAYAFYLKEYYHRLEHSGHQSVLSTTVICLDHNNQATAPMRLINSLPWEDAGNEWAHLDSVILSEKYREDAGRVIGSMQTYIAGLLLYALLIIPPTHMRPVPPNLEEHFPTPLHTKAKRSMHPNTYLVGLSAVEFSVSWGRRLLNYGLAEEAVQVLQDRTFDDEQARTASVVETWLSDWRAVVGSAVPGNIPALAAFAHAAATAKPADEVFPSKRPSIHMAETTRRDLQQYVTRVAQTYTLSTSERETIRKEKQVESTAQKPTVAPTLRDALESIPLLQQSVHTWENEYPETPLVEAQTQAHRVLAHPQFFLGAQGAIPRAKLQLKELAKAIGVFQTKHKQASIDLDERRRAFVQFGQDKINDVQTYIDTFPLLATVLGLKRPMAWLTLLLVALISLVGVVISFSWLRHLVLLLLPNLTTTLDATLFTISFFTFVLLTALVVTLLIVLFGIRRTILAKHRSPLKVETTFWVSLVVLAGLGLIVSLSIRLFAPVFVGDPDSYRVLLWLSDLPLWSTVMFLIAVVILMVEGIYFLHWSRELARERKQIIEELRAKHKEALHDLSQYISDALALHLLQRAELTDGKTGHGLYYQRMDQLSKRFDLVLQEAKDQHMLAAHRLSYESEVPAHAPSLKTPTLIIRDELLDVQALTINYQRLKNSLRNKREELTEFSEALLRVMGEETPRSIEQQLREKSSLGQQPGEQLFQVSREQHQAEVLLATSAAVALRLATEATVGDSVTPLSERYQELDYRIAHQCSRLKPLIDILQETVSKATLNPQGSTSSEEQKTDLATKAIADWVQIVWEHKESQLDQVLMPGGVMAKLVRDGHSPQTVETRLDIRANLGGRSLLLGQEAEFYLLVFPSPQGRRFLQDMRLEPFTIDFPDPERLLWLYVQHYASEPYFIKEEAEPVVAQLGPGSVQPQSTDGIATQE